MKNKTPWDDWLINLLDIVEKLVIKVDRLKEYMKSKKFKSVKDTKHRIVGYSKRINAVSTTPRGYYGARKYIKFTLTDDYEKLLMEDASKLNVYLMDYSYLDLEDRTFYISGKSAAQRFLLKDDATSYRDTHQINKYLESKEPFDNMFYVEEVKSDVWKSVPDNKKIKQVKDGV